MTYDDVHGTAPLEPTPEQLARAQAQRVVPDFPEKLSDPDLRLIRRPPSNPLTDSYRLQQYGFRDGDHRYWLTPALPGTDHGSSVEPPLKLPVHFVSGWHRDGLPSTFAECISAQGELNARLTELKVGRRFAVAVAGDRTWFEGLAMLPGLGDDQALELARTYGQAAAIRWNEDSLVVLPTGLRPEVGSSTTGWRLESAKVATCPVRADADPAGRCTNHGGPYGSSAIHAAGLWKPHRSVAVTLLGCGPCADGSEPIWGHPLGGGAISLADEIIGNRYGGYTWRP